MKQPRFQQLNTFFLCLLFFTAPLYCDPAGANNRENEIVKAVRLVSPAVVNISSEHEFKSRGNPFYGFGMDSFFDSFFRDFFDPGFERPYKRSSLGSGVIIDGKRGLVLTNEHVVLKSAKITIILRDEREFEAQIVGADPDSDLAVLRIHSTEPLPAIEMGNSDDLMIGETIIAIGNPFGFSHTVTTGVISAINRNIRTDNRIYQDFIQTDASINPGNSGGPLLNILGELIGINTAIYAKAQGIGFAIPINRAKRIISDLIQYGEVVPAWVGISVQPLDPQIAAYKGFAGKSGVLVKESDAESPADNAGIKPGDIMASIGNTPVFSPHDYRAAIKNYAAGDIIKMDMLRNAQKITIFVKTTAFPIEKALDLAYKLLGVKVLNISEKKQFKRKITAEQGVIISEINRSSDLFRIGVTAGDVIRKIDDILILDIETFKKAVIKFREKSSVVVWVQREDQGYYITVKTN